MKRILVLSLLATGLTRAASLEQFDFQAETSGTLPKNVSTINATRDGNSILIVDGTTSPVDPIGGATGNKSLYLSYKAGVAWRTPWADFPIPDAQVAAGSGQVAFDLLVPSSDGPPGIVEIDLGQHNAKDLPSIARLSSAIALQIVTTGNAPHMGLLRFYSGGKWVNFQNSFPLDVKNKVAIRWDLRTRKVSVTLNGEAVTIADSSGNSLPFVEPNIGGATGLRFTAAGLAPVACFLDNIDVSIPD